MGSNSRRKKRAIREQESNAMTHPTDQELRILATVLRTKSKTQWDRCREKRTVSPGAVAISHDQARQIADGIDGLLSRLAKPGVEVRTQIPHVSYDDDTLCIGWSAAGILLAISIDGSACLAFKGINGHYATGNQEIDAEALQKVVRLLEPAPPAQKAEPLPMQGACAFCDAGPDVVECPYGDILPRCPRSTSKLPSPQADSSIRDGVIEECARLFENDPWPDDPEYLYGSESAALIRTIKSSPAATGLDAKGERG